VIAQLKRFDYQAAGVIGAGGACVHPPPPLVDLFSVVAPRGSATPPRL
jgi:hypothetical protein